MVRDCRGGKLSADFQKKLEEWNKILDQKERIKLAKKLELVEKLDEYAKKSDYAQQMLKAQKITGIQSRYQLLQKALEEEIKIMEQMKISLDHNDPAQVLIDCKIQHSPNAEISLHKVCNMMEKEKNYPKSPSQDSGYQYQ